MKKNVVFIVLLFAANLLHAQTNTFPATGNVGIGTTSPTSKLTVSGDLWTDGFKNTNAYGEKILSIPIFPNLTPNLAVDLRLGNLRISGYIEVEVTGFYNYAPAMGKLTKIFAVGTNPNGPIYTNESRVSDAMGTITNQISIGEFSWDAENSVFKIPISHITSASNTFSVKVRIFSQSSSLTDIQNAMTLSSQYTLQALPKNYVNFNGNVGIGTTMPTEKLSVKGKIRAQEIKVENTNWPDYVFTKDYQLPSLQETEKYIKEKGYLPGIPSAEDVKTNGIELGEMNAKLLQKIEELTLYIIEQNKTNQQILLDNKRQQEEIDSLKKQSK